MGVVRKVGDDFLGVLVHKSEPFQPREHLRVLVHAHVTGAFVRTVVNVCAVEGDEIDRLSADLRKIFVVLLGQQPRVVQVQDTLVPLFDEEEQGVAGGMLRFEEKDPKRASSKALSTYRRTLSFTSGLISRRVLSQKISHTSSLPKISSSGDVMSEANL